MRVVILFGGRTLEHHSSVASGVAVARAASERGHEVRLVDPAEGGPRHGVFAALTGDPVLGDLLRADLVFPAVHGGWGGDGHLQALLEMAGVPFTGAGSVACALAWDKPRTLGELRSADVPTPAWSTWRHGCEDPPVDVWRLLKTGSVVVKEAVGTCPRTFQVARTPAQLRDACRLAHDGEALIAMPYLPGREFTVAVVGGQALPVVEIRRCRPLFEVPAKAGNGTVVWQCPAEIPAPLARELARHAAAAHRALGLGERAYSRVDFRCDGDGRALCLEVDACPALWPGSGLPRAAQAAGWAYGDLVERIMDLAVAPAATVVRQPG